MVENGPYSEEIVDINNGSSDYQIRREPSRNNSQLR